MKQTHTLISLATAWGPKYGGINAFNYDLLIAVAAANWQWLRVICVVSTCTADEVQSAKVQNQVELIDLGLDGGSIGKEHAALAWQKLQDANVGNANENVVWLGHDRITGAVCIDLTKKHGGRSALIHHMSYAHYESFAEDSATANRKVKEQNQLFTEANICLAVGPLLRKSLADVLDKRADDVTMLIPGLAEITPRKNHNSFIAFVSGRLDKGARKLKQAHLGVAGFAHAIQRCDSDPGLPDMLRGEFEPRIILRGVDLEDLAADLPGAETELKAFAEVHAMRVIALQALPFTQDRTELFDELRAACVCLMPSWHEGFGLVAWEAIAAGVPLILSKKSGVYQFLESQRKENLVHPIDVRGHGSHPFFADTDKYGLANSLIQIAKNHPRMCADASRLREDLLKDYHWRACADAFVAALKWQAPPAREFALPQQQLQLSDTRPKNITGLDRWINLPSPIWHLHTGLSPSQLLKAEEALIPFAQERAAFLQEQMDWVTEQTHPIRVRLLTGEGGTGKTRLALEICKRLVAEDWAAGFIKTDDPHQVSAFVKELSQNTQPVLLVLDYAESRTDLLLSILEALLTRETQQLIRLLLLARSSGEWWGQLPSRNSRCEALLDGFATTGPHPLPPLYTQLAERNNAFTQAVGAFAQVLDVEAPNILPDLSAEQYQKPLYLQMAALLTHLGEHTANAELLPQSLVRHEQRYWHKVTAESSEADATLLMSLVTLVGSATTTKAIEPFWVGGRTSSLKSLFASLSPLYPAHQGLGALQPDLLGEALVSRQVLGSSGEALLDAALGEKANSAQRSHALTVLARLLRYRSDLSSPLKVALTKHFPRCAQELFQVCIQTPSPLPLIVEQSFKQLRPPIALQVAGMLERNFEHEILPLAGLKLLVCETLNEQAWRRYEKPKCSLDDRNVLGKTLIKLSVAYAQLGRDIEALECGRQSLDVRKRLANEKPERFESDWAGTLGNYSNRLANVGDATQALAYSKQALDIYERLAKEKPERFKPNFAGALNNHANRLGDAGDPTQALAYSKQALDIYNLLAIEKPERFESYYAGALHNYARRLADVGDATQALANSKRALDIFERLAKEKPERFEPNFAGALINYANRQVEVGDTAQALIYSKQALDIYERLAKVKPERFEPDSAGALDNYANRLAEVGDSTQALVYSKQALDIYKRLADEKPERFEPDWAGALNNYANHLANAGDPTLALANSAHVLDIYGRLAKEKPERFESDWAMSLNNYAYRLADAGELTQALVNIKLALTIYKQLANERPMKFQANALDAQLTGALWTWLVESASQLLIPAVEIGGTEVPHTMRPAYFSYQVLQVLKVEQAHRNTAFEEVWARWNEMSKAQQTEEENVFLLVCAYAEANKCLPDYLGGWRSKIKILNTRRSGTLPKWMTQIAERKGFSLGV